MDNKRKQLLRSNREDIGRDLDILDIIDSLISSHAIKIEEFEEINCLKSRSDKVFRLLDIIQRGNNKIYDKFVDSLYKNYNWLWKSLQTDTDTIPTEISKEDFKDSLSNGDVPKLPNHYVARESLEAQLVEKLSNIKRHEVLILHGIPCSGKSSLVNGTLRNNESLITTHFNEKVYWLNVSDCITDEHIIQQQMRLLRKISPDALYRSQLFNTSTTMNTSVSVTSLGSYSGSQYFSLYDKNTEENRELLKKAFQEEPYRDALLIIDDLKDKNVAEAFAIDCKILITAQDLHIRNPNDIIMQVKAELEEDESLRLISYYVRKDVSKLPKEARNLHQLCRGNPLLLSMMGSILEENKESLNDNPQQWKHYVKQLKNKPNFIERHLIKNKTNQTDVFTAVKMCIDSLDNPSWIKAFKSLVILKDNVKISATTFSIICDMNPDDVEVFIKSLKDKSLITAHYNTDIKSYQYEIQDLVITYLKKHFHDKNEDLKTLHVELLNNYMRKNSNLINVPEDGYICYHLGYHILETSNRDNMHDLFKKLYRNLEFIGEKIRLTSYNSILWDLNTYCKYIKIGTENDDDEFYDELIKYISRHGLDLCRYPDTDILQSILQHEPKGILYAEASKLIQKNHKDHLYLQFQNDSPTQQLPISIVVDKNLTIIRFWSHYIFVGNETGNITLWSILTFDKLAEYTGHTNPIKSIAISFEKPFKMAATSVDGSLRIWNIDHLVDANDNDCLESDSIDFVYETCSSVLNLTDKSGVLCDVNWGRKSNMLLTHTNPGSKIILYNPDGTLHKSHNVENSIITASILSLDDALAIIAYESNERSYGVHMYCTKNFNLLMTFIEYNPILMLSIVSDSPKTIFVLTNNYYQLHSWNKIMLSDPTKAAKNINNFRQSCNYCEFITASIGNKHPYVFIATTTNHIHIYKLKTGERIGELDNYRSPIVSMDISMDMDNESINNMYGNYSFLVAACQDDKNSVKLWVLNPAEYSVTARKTSNFCCTFDTSNCRAIKNNVMRSSTMIRPKPRRSVQKTASLDRSSLQLSIGDALFENTVIPLIATVTSSNSIQFFRGKTLITETDVSEKIITSITLSPCSLYIVYGLKNGDVIRTTIKTKENQKIMNINEEVSYLEFLSGTKLMAAGKNKVLMMNEFSTDEPNKFSAKMIINSKNELGSQELLESFVRRKPSEGSPSCSGSPLSASSTSSLTDNSNCTFSKRIKSDNYLNKFSPILKCFLLKNDTFLTLSHDSVVKIWDFTPKLLGVLIGKQNMYLSCVCLQSNFLLLCNDSGYFQIHQLFNSDMEIPIEAELLFSNKIDEHIICCSICDDQKFMAMGCESGNIVLWSISDQRLIRRIRFHKSPVKCVKFSPMPSDFQSSVRYYSSNDPSRQVFPPMVLISLAGQIAWWNLSHIYSEYCKKQKKSRTRNGNILSPVSLILPNNPSVEDLLNKQQISVTSTNGFSYKDTDWENLWRGKRSKSHYKRDDLITCIKLKGEKALDIVTDANFSVFVTIDGGGALYIMKVVDTANSINGSVPSE